MRFPRGSRLKRKAEFDRVFTEAHVRVRQGPLQALASHSLLERPRLGLIVGRRHARRAVDRNRVKRKIRESFRAHAGLLPPVDVVIQLIGPPDDRDLGRSLESIWRRVCRASDTAPCQPRATS